MAQWNHLFRAAALLQSAVGLLFLWLGVAKAVYHEDFRTVVIAHGLFPNHERWIVAGVALAETIAGLALIVTAGRRSAPLGLGYASLLLVCFMIYISIVPSSALAQSGCGCGIRPSDRDGGSSLVLVRNAIGIMMLGGLGALTAVARRRLGEENGGTRPTRS